MAFTLVVTTIAAPNRALEALAQGCFQNGNQFVVVGDVSSPAEFRMEHCEYFSLARQIETGFHSARLLPTRHYSRKNIGYLIAMRAGAPQIVETDDDNLPTASFWKQRSDQVAAVVVAGTGWLNAYGYFTDLRIWPRGLPLDVIVEPPPPYESLPNRRVTCPIQQGLADGNPDVDAIYRLLMDLPVRFATPGDHPIALGEGAWCPFNSQNTTWFPPAYPLLYLPSTCSFRMTDIWRSFVAQRILWENQWFLLFHGPTVWQDRNDHDLMKDFRDEIPGYLNNRRIATALESVRLRAGAQHTGENMAICYEALIGLGVIEPNELALLGAWLKDLAELPPLDPVASERSSCSTILTQDGLPAPSSAPPKRTS